MDVEGLCSYTDAIIVSHGTSTRQAQTIAEHIREQMKKKGTPALGVEGEGEARWVVLDYGDVVFHVFYKPIREFYNLEGIWPDARQGEARSEKDGFQLKWKTKKKAAAKARSPKADEAAGAKP